MSISGVSGVSSASAGANLNLQDFMQVLMAQLSYQNPLKPMDNQEFLAQIAQFTALGQTQEMNANLQTLLSNQAAQQAVGLLGRTVSFSRSGVTQSGVVAQIDLTGVTPQLTINTAGGSFPGISLSQISNVQ